MVEEVKEEEKVGSLSPPRIKTGKGGSSSSSELHPQEVMLIRRLWYGGWSDYQIWKEYRIPIPFIQKAKDEIERQAIEDFDNKGQQAFELAKLKDRLKVVIDTNDAITKNPNVSYADRLNSERIKLDALAILRDVVEASISCSDPYSALEKIAKQSNKCCRQ